MVIWTTSSPMKKRISTGGKMRLGVKADLLRCLESDLLEDNVNNRAPIPDATILDGAVVV